MPQMSPLMWLILYFYFIMLFIFMNMLIYYFTFNVKNFIYKNKINFSNFKWLW